MNKDELLKSMSADERRQLLRELQQQDKEEREARRDAYEGLRAEFMQDVKNKLLPVVEDVKDREGSRRIPGDDARLRPSSSRGPIKLYDRGW